MRWQRLQRRSRRLGWALGSVPPSPPFPCKGDRAPLPRSGAGLPPHPRPRSWTALASSATPGQPFIRPLPPLTLPQGPPPVLSFARWRSEGPRPADEPENSLCPPFPAASSIAVARCGDKPSWVPLPLLISCVTQSVLFSG